MKIRTVILGAAAGIGALMALAAPASAYVVCNAGGDCWHTEARYHYPEAGYVYHPDDWYFHRHWDAGRFHDYHEGRGYYRNGLWVTF
jgi:hypothetical protein